MRVIATPILIALCLSAGLAGCERPSEAQEPAAISGALTRHEPTRVRVLPVVRREMRRALETTTVVESERQVEIHPRMAGEIVELLAEEGDRVEKDQVLARLDQRDAQVQLADAKIGLKEARDAEAKGEIAQREALAKIERLRLAFEQAKRSFERNDKARLISAQDLEKLELEMETAESDHASAILEKDRIEIEGRASATAVERADLAVERAQVTLSYTEIRAPFGGVIANRTCQVGDNASSAAAVFKITDLSDLRTVFYRPQRELAVFTGVGSATGDGEVPGYSQIEVSATSEALPGHTFRGHIERISPEIDSSSGSFRVTVRLVPEADGVRLLPGMLLRLKLITERHEDAIAVSKRALKARGMRPSCSSPAPAWPSASKSSRASPTMSSSR